MLLFNKHIYSMNYMILRWRENVIPPPFILNMLVCCHLLCNALSLFFFFIVITIHYKRSIYSTTVSTVDIVGNEN